MDTWVLQNEHANVALFDLVYSPDDDNLLVGALVASTSKTLFTAIKAQLEKNGGNQLTAIKLSGERETVRLRGAGRGYLCVETPLLKAGATGSAYIVAHKATADPRESSAAAFYVLATADADLTALFAERLRVSSVYAVRPQWGEYLLEMGIEDVRGLAVRINHASPFDYSNQAMLYTPHGLIPAYGDGEQAYAQKLTDEVERLVTISRGRAFVLCTSMRRTEQLFEALEPRLPYTCYCQGTASRSELLDRFRDNPEGAVLFATEFLGRGGHSGRGAIAGYHGYCRPVD